VRASWSNIGKAQEILEFEPKVSIENGIKSFTQWYTDEPENALKVNPK
jgi:nucleoside-diphosphate-sugar epimerase